MGMMKDTTITDESEYVFAKEERDRILKQIDEEVAWALHSVTMQQSKRDADHWNSMAQGMSHIRRVIGGDQ